MDTTTPFRICTCTWNVHETSPPENFTPLLGLQQLNLPGIFAIGLQEVKTLGKNLITDAVSEDEWTTSLTTAMKKRNYVRIEAIRLWGIALLIFAKRPELQYITRIETQYTRTGLNGFWGNKGGVSVRMSVAGVTVCFVNSHLPHHIEQIGQRIQDYTSIVESQIFVANERMSILDHDYVFWMGDLNFRIDDVNRDAIIKHVVDESYKDLWPHDQLLKTMKEELVFIDFKEGPLNFAPTYKFDPGTDTYDTSVKQRIPAWTDRILWLVHDKSLNDNIELSVKQLSYKSHQEYKASDHKPVVGEFEVQVLHRSPEPLVEFDMVDNWTHSKEGVVTFTVAYGFKISSWDWIGIYKEDFEHYKDYVTYIWSTTSSYRDTMDGRDHYRVTLDKSYTQALVGRHCLCYYSSNLKSIVGHSDCFKIMVSEADDSSTSSSMKSGSESESSSASSSASSSKDVRKSLRTVRHRLMRSGLSRRISREDYELDPHRKLSDDLYRDSDDDRDEL